MRINARPFHPELSLPPGPRHLLLTAVTAAPAGLLLPLPWPWPLSLYTHFRLQAALAITLLALLLRLRGRSRTALLAAAVALFHVLPLAPYASIAPAAAAPEEISVLVANNYVFNPTPGTIAGAIERSAPDLVVLVEGTPELAAALAPLEETYPFRYVVPRDTPGGKIVLSRHPLELLEVSRAMGALLFRWQAGAEPVTLAVVHTRSPTGAGAERERDAQLAALGRRLAGENRPVLLVGDLNTTPWSPPLAALRRDAGLHEARAGRGVQATWPAFLGPLGIPIDHALGSAQIRFTHLSVPARTGSDHRPLLLRFFITS